MTKKCFTVACTPLIILFNCGIVVRQPSSNVRNTDCPPEQCAQVGLPSLHRQESQPITEAVCLTMPREGGCQLAPWLDDLTTVVYTHHTIRIVENTEYNLIRYA